MPDRNLKPFRLPGVLSLSLTAALIAAGPTLADEFDAPAGYYDSATGSGATLASQLHNIIDGHFVRSFGDARSALQVTDQDPNDPDRLRLAYDGTSIDVSQINPNGSIPGWDSGVTWNREHTWPRARGIGSSGADDSDLHQLRPSNPQVNSNRGSLNFGGAFGQSFGVVSDGGQTVWYPGDDEAGLTARQQFYVAVRYDGSDIATEDLRLVSGNPGFGNTLGDIDRLLEWHYLAPPDDFERRRNQVIFDEFQFNRNPFIDRPEFVHSVFVDNANDTRLSLAGAAPNADGSSSLDVDLGTVIVGALSPRATQTVTLNKTGLDGTFYRVTTSGDVTSSVTGGLNAFALGASGSQTIEVGLAPSSVFAQTPGVFGGSVTIDNLDVTDGGGAGVGSRDGDDVIDLSYSVLGHSNASFTSGIDINHLTLDFGAVALTEAAGADLDFSIFNLDALSGFTAGLDFDNLLSIGDTQAFDLGLDLFSNLAAGEGFGFTASIEEGVAAGIYEANYALVFSDQDLPGAIQVDPLTLTLNLEIVAGTPEFLTGDYNGDGFVSQADLDLVLLSFGDTVLPEGWIAIDQFDGDLVSQNELDAVLLNFGSGTPSLATIPEPGTLSIVAMVFAGALRRPSTARRGA